MRVIPMIYLNKTLNLLNTNRLVMKQNFKKYITLTAIILFVSSSVFSQNNTLYWMKHLPQSMNTNPAKQSNCKFFIDIPVLPNFQFDVAHTGFSLDDAIMEHPTAQDSFMIDLVTLNDALGKNRNSFDFSTEFSLINLGFALKNNMYFTFGINYKFSENFQYPKALIEITKGNYRPNGEPLSFDFRESFMSHRELYIGISKSFYDKLYIGGRLKFLNGYANIDAKKMNVKWYTSTNPDSIYNWRFESDFDINASFPVAWELIEDSVGKITDVKTEDITIDENNIYGSIKDIIPHNFGMGIDLGIEYQINKNILVSASVVDLGFIKWKTNPANIKLEGAKYTFSGLDIANYVGSYDDALGADEDDANSMGDDIIDTLTVLFTPSITENSYTTGLNTKIYLGGNFAVKEWLDFGLLYKGIVMNKSLYSSATVSANLNFFRGWSYTLSYSMIDRLANNIGMGLAYKLGPFQMYFITDNVAVPLSVAFDTPTTNKWIRNTKRANFAFGMNFTLCKKKHDIGLLE